MIGVVKYPDRRLVRGWLVLAGLAIWLAFGRHLVLYALAFRTVPGMNWFRVPARSLFLANLAGTVLAGLGVETLRHHLTTRHDWRKLAIRYTGLFLTLFASLFLILLLRGHDGSSRTAAAVSRVLGNGCFWLTLGSHDGRRTHRKPCDQPASSAPCWRMVGSARFWASWVVWVLRCSRWRPRTEFLGDDPDRRRDHPDQSRFTSVRRIRIKARDSFYGDLQAAVRGVEKTNITDVFQLGHAARLYEILYPVASFQRRWRDDPMQTAVDDYNRRSPPGGLRPVECQLPGFRSVRGRPGMACRRARSVRSIILGHPA